LKIINLRLRKLRCASYFFFIFFICLSNTTAYDRLINSSGIQNDENRKIYFTSDFEYLRFGELLLFKANIFLKPQNKSALENEAALYGGYKISNLFYIYTGLNAACLFCDNIKFSPVLGAYAAKKNLKLYAQYKFSNAFIIKTSMIAKSFLPVEFSIEAGKEKSKPFYYAVTTGLHVAKGAALFAGYNFQSESILSGGWIFLKNRASIKIEIDYGHFEKNLRSAKIIFQSSWNKPSLKVEEKPTKIPQKKEDAKISVYKKEYQNQKYKTKKKKLKTYKLKLPPFKVLIKWGISPAEAISIIQKNDICGVSYGARKILNSKKYMCYENKR